MLFKNKVVIVTGSRRGIGKSIAIAFAKEGADVVVSDVDLVECKKVSAEIEKLGSKSLSIKCDVSKKSDIDNLISQTVRKFGKIDVLVNNAGIYRSTPLLDMKEKEWDAVLNINLRSVYLCTQAAVKMMLKNRIKGSIVNIASIAGEVGFANSSAYCASKGGIVVMTKELAMELAPLGIRVNAIGPGPIKTPMTSFIQDDPKTMKAILAGVPLGRMGEPEEIADAAVFLASRKASYITGQTLFVDGGWTSQ